MSAARRISLISACSLVALTAVGVLGYLLYKFMDNPNRAYKTAQQDQDYWVKRQAELRQKFMDEDRLRFIPAAINPFQRGVIGQEAAAIANPALPWKQGVGEAEVTISNAWLPTFKVRPNPDAPSPVYLPEATANLPIRPNPDQPLPATIAMIDIPWQRRATESTEVNFAQVPGFPRRPNPDTPDPVALISPESPLLRSSAAPHAAAVGAPAVPFQRTSAEPAVVNLAALPDLPRRPNPDHPDPAAVASPAVPWARSASEPQPIDLASAGPVKIRPYQKPSTRPATNPVAAKSPQ